MAGPDNQRSKFLAMDGKSQIKRTPGLRAMARRRPNARPRPTHREGRQDHEPSQQRPLRDPGLRLHHLTGLTGEGWVPAFAGMTAEGMPEVKAAPRAVATACAALASSDKA
jgi:hypothetical protein